MRSRDQRALRAGAALAVVAVLVLRIVPAIWADARNNWQTFSLRAEQLQRARWNIVQTAALEDSAAAIKAGIMGLAPKLLSADSEAEARADLASRLRRAAAANRLRLNESQPVPDSSRAGRLRRVSIGAVLEGDSRGTLRMLQALAAGPAALTPAELEITSTNPRAPASAPEVLRVKLLLRGWYLTRDPRR